jgi:hypothetical protein
MYLIVSTRTRVILQARSTSHTEMEVWGSNTTCDAWRLKLMQSFTKMALDRGASRTQLAPLWDSKCSLVATHVLTLAKDTVGKRGESIEDMRAIRALFVSWKLSEEYVLLQIPQTEAETSLAAI